MAMEVRYWNGSQWMYRMEHDVGKIETMLADEEADRAAAEEAAREEDEMRAEEERLEAEARDADLA